MQIGTMPGLQLEYINALVDEFANQVKQAASGMDAAVLAKSFQDFRPDTVRTTEGRLRDAFGLSRSASKRIAPLIMETLTNNVEVKDEAVTVIEVESRERLNVKLNLLRMKARTNEY
jgi:hypothetical protein